MIISFYSYKGGVGRSQLLANLSSYFSNITNKKVLIIDWDLEAPGVHFFFKKTKSIVKPGLIDLFIDYSRLIDQTKSITKDIVSNYISENIQKYIINDVGNIKSEHGRIDLMPAALYDESYTNKISLFDWGKFYENLDGANFIEILKENLKINLGYDYILIDSRTGISDYSGICNIQMPDINIIVVAPTKQNVEGSNKVIEKIKNSSYINLEHRRFPIIFPILSRLDKSNDVESGKWLKDFENEFKNTIVDIISFTFGLLKNVERNNQQHYNLDYFKGDVTEYIDSTLLNYVTDISYGESLLFEDGLKNDNTPFEKQLINIANIVLAFEYFPIVRFELLPFTKLKKAISHYFDTRKLYKKANLLIDDFISTPLDNERVRLQLLGEIKSIYSSNEISSIYSKDRIYLNNLSVDLSSEFETIRDYLHQIETGHLLDKKRDISHLSEDKYQTKLITQNFKRLVLSLITLYTSAQSESNKLKSILESISKSNLTKNANKLYDPLIINDLYTKIMQLAPLLKIFRLYDLSESFSLLGQITLLNFNYPNRYNIAKDYFKKSIQLDKYFNNIFQYAVLLHEIENYDEAHIYYNLAEAFASTRVDKAKALNNLSLVYKSKNDFGLAIETLFRLLEIFNDNIEDEEAIKSDIIFNLANLHQSVNELDKALDLYHEALNIRLKLANIESQSNHPDVATIFNNLADIYTSLNNYAEAEKYYRNALAIRQNLSDSNPQAYLLDVAMTLNNLANLLKNVNRYDEAEDFYKKALQNYEKLADNSPKILLSEVATILNNLATLFRDTNRYAEAETAYQQALSIYRALVQENSQVYLPALAQTLHNLATLQTDTNQYIEAETAYQEALSIYRSFAKVNPQVYLPPLAQTLNNLGTLQKNINHYEEAESTYKEALSIRRGLAEENPQVYLSAVAQTLNNLAISHTDTNRYAEAEPAYQQALTIYQRLADENPQVYLSAIAQTLNNLAISYTDTNRYAEAEPAYQQALTIYQRLADENPQVYFPAIAQTLHNLAILYRNTNRYAEAEPAYQQALTIYQRLADENPQVYLSLLAQTLHNLAILYTDTNRYSEAEPTYQQALSIYQRLAAENPQVYLPTVARTAISMCILYLKIVSNKEKTLSLVKMAVQSALPFVEHSTLAKQVMELANYILKEWDINPDEFIRDTLQNSAFKGKLRIFFSYSHKDEIYRDELEKHLIALKRSNLIETWYDRKITPMDNWDNSIKEQLENADIILLLVSADFLASNYFWEKELEIIKRRQASQGGTFKVIPIFLKPSDLEDLDQIYYQGLPSERKWILSSQWPFRDEAYENVATNLRRLFTEMAKVS